MAQVVVLADPPRDGLVLPQVPESSSLSTKDATSLYTAFLRDAVSAAAGTSADLLVNYRPANALPAGHQDVDAESVVREAIDAALADPGGVRFEEQVGSTRSARVGNTVTHLLAEEDATSVVVVDPQAPTLSRTALGDLTMKLRRSDVVVVPSTRGRVAAVGFAETLDFEDVLTAPALTKVTDRAVAADLAVDFTDLHPLVETGGDVASLVAAVRARAAADRPRPEFTATTIEDRAIGLSVTDDDVSAVPGTDSS